jgi:hypothetical protein
VRSYTSVRALGDLLGVNGTGERPDDRDHTQAGQTNLRGNRSGERGPRRLRGVDPLSRLSVAGRLHLVFTLAERRQQLVEAAQLQALEAEPVADLRHRLHGAVHIVVEIHRGRALIAGDRLPLPQQRGLAHTSVAPDMEEELVVVVQRIPGKVLPEDADLVAPADETAPATAPDQLLA